MKKLPIDESEILPGLIQPLLDLLEDGVVVHDENRRIYLVNEATERITGRAREEIIGMDCHETFPPNGLCGSHCAFKGGFSDAASRRREADVSFTAADGELKRIRVRSDPILIGGKRRGVIAVVRDVTEVSDLRWRLSSRQDFHGMIGVSRAVNEVFETIRAVGPSEYPVLITGESGTGKELAAGAIHRESRRKAGPFVPVNCGALPTNILESELFGHVRGAFTGAIRDKKGRFELAEGGTLFLDEVGELPLDVQVKLLRVIQEKCFERVGGERTIKADVRIVAATNRDLKAMVSSGEFREDLYYRLCVVPMELPPLRDRIEDIPHLTDQILLNIARETGREVEGIDDRAMGALLAHAWPGNIRELINALQYASVRSTEPTIQLEHLPLEVRGPRPSVDGERAGPTAGAPAVIDPAAPLAPAARRGRNKLDTDSVERALAAAGGNKVRAAKLLGVGRATLYRFIDKQKS
jgi:PAS domain S-box-containing protein